MMKTTCLGIDFSKAVRGLHHFPASSRIFLPVSIERSVWEYFSGKAEQKGVDLSELLTEVLRLEMQIDQALG